ncbi:unnamed protein product, partial [Discosporangium mesarthrocarpum]
MLYGNGNIYVGSWVNGLRHGKGILTKRNGPRYEGRFIHDRMTGKVRESPRPSGTKIYPDNRRYVGLMRNGERHGAGTMTYPNGVRYHGQYRFDKREGHGVMQYTNGECYDGYWMDDMKHGQ